MYDEILFIAESGLPYRESRLLNRAFTTPFVFAGHYGSDCRRNHCVYERRRKSGSCAFLVKR